MDDEALEPSLAARAVSAVAASPERLSARDTLDLLAACMEIHFCDRSITDLDEIEAQATALRDLGPLMRTALEAHMPRVLSAGRIEPVHGTQLETRTVYVGYMFWDVSPCPVVCTREGMAACLDAMEHATRSGHPGVVKGAFHGLGHAASCISPGRHGLHKRRVALIQRANLSIPGFEASLRRYASAALAGVVQ